MPIDPNAFLEGARAGGSLLGPGPTQRAATQATLENVRAQGELRRQEAEARDLANQEVQAKQFAGQAVKTMLSVNKNPTIRDFQVAAGPYAEPYAKLYYDGKKQDMDAQKQEVEKHSKLLGELGNLAIGLKGLETSARPKAHADAVQGWLQSGMIDEAEANDMLSSYDTDEELDQIIARTPAHQAEFENARKLIDDQAKRLDMDFKRGQIAGQNKATRLDEVYRGGHKILTMQKPDGTTYEVDEGQAESAPRAQVPGTDVPLPADVVAQRKDIAQSGRQPATVVIDTVDANGKPVKKVVPRTLGSEFPMAPTAQERTESGRGNRAKPVLDAIDELSEKINTQAGVIAKISGAAEKEKAKINLNDDVSEYEAVLSGFIPLVARAVGHTGVLTEQDVQSVRKMFPDPGDSKSVRDRKIARIRSLMSASASPSSSGPQVGTVEGGYRFKGGNPADKSNWEKVQ